MAVYRSVDELIGGTPVLDVSRLSPNPSVKLFAKLEGHNPTGSVKDRVALAMLDQAEAEGRLQPGSVIIEPSSGNTGIALAMLGQRRGYAVKIVLPGNVTAERRQMLEIYGAEIISSPAEQGSNGAVRMALELADANPDWTMLYQYGNEANPQVHYRTTGPEIVADVGGITHFIAGLGTSGTLLGAGRYLKEHVAGVQVWAVEPPAGEQVEGLRSLDEGYVPPIFEDWGGAELLDRKMIVRPRESIEATRMLATEGVFSGISGGAALAGARKAAASVDSGVIVFVVSDHGWKYLSVGAWTDDLEVAAANADGVIYF
ncbi:PLP-dependent cysteine synthase family protein [Candidatus Poriferisodalis sp.]|uniref:PLP-dependent cysteine synthase family protein n=1 Tax=Candidatus Poriferisodalis sp. TaxID=3101277 RepID=UPI003B019701